MAKNKLRVEILKPSNYEDTSNVVLQRVDTVAERGLYTDAKNLVYEQRLGYITLEPRYRFEDEPPSAWSVFSLTSSYDPITKRPISISSWESSHPSLLYAAKPSMFSTRFSSENNIFYGVAVPPSVGVLRYNKILGSNRPFCVLIHCRSMPANRSPVPLPPLRIYWGGATEAMKAYERAQYGGLGLSDPNHPFINSHWAIDITGGSNMDRVHLHVENVGTDGGGSSDYSTEWKQLAMCRLTHGKSVSSPFGENIGLLIEPKPPTAISITDIYSKNSVQINAYRIEDVEWARDNNVDYGFWYEGYVSICHTSSIVAYVVPMEYEKEGSYISEVFRLSRPLESIPTRSHNIPTPILNPGDDPDKPSNRIPGMEPSGTNIDVSIWKADEDEELTQSDLEDPENNPVTSFRYKVVMTSTAGPSGYASVTPFLRNVALAALPYIDQEEIQPKIDVTKDVTGLRITKTIDNVRRTAYMTLRNDKGIYNFLLRAHAVPVRIYIDDKLYYCGYVSYASEKLEGRKTTLNYEEDYAPTEDIAGAGVEWILKNPGYPVNIVRGHLRQVSLQLEDHWSRLDHCRLAKHLCWNCDWLYHNVAIWHLMRLKAGFPASKLNMPKNENGDEPKVIYQADAASMGVYGTSLILTADYTAEVPTWAPEMGESLASFITRIHEARGGAWWEMFFDDDGSFYYQPMPNRRESGENKFTFVESTKEAEGKGGDYLPIMGTPILDVNFDEYRNDFWVAGQIRPWQEVYGTSPPIKDDPVYDYTPFWVNFRIPGSWTVQDPEYQFYVGEKRTVLVFNPAIVTVEEANLLCLWLAYKYGAPRRTYRFRSYFKRDIRPGQWGTMKYKGQELKVRLRSMEVDFSTRLGGTDHRYDEGSGGAVGWLCDYEVEIVLPWEWF